MGNKVASPIPTVDIVNQHLDQQELSHIRTLFLSISNNDRYITLQQFRSSLQSRTSEYSRYHFVPRMFTIIDTKKDGYIDYDEFACAVALFRIGGTEDKIKFLYLMYEPKNGILPRDNLRTLLIDALLSVQDDSNPLHVMEKWMSDQMELTDGMTDLALQQYAANPSRMDFNEFLSFIKIEGTIQTLLQKISMLIDS